MAKSSHDSNAKPKDWNSYCQQLPTCPGVYLFLDGKKNVLYVGKAKNLRNRLKSWLLRPVLGLRHQALLGRLHNVDIIVSQNELEALLLENNLIKEYQPPYNVLLKDNKSYPWIRMNVQHDFPGAYFFRGARKSKEDYFGPYPDTPSVRRILRLIHKVFKLRQCSDSFFNARRRPCLQYQINNCSAPCVGYIGKDEYRESVRQCQLFIKGKRKAVAQNLQSQMESLAKNQQYEEAAKMRDAINAIRVINTDQIAVGENENIDFIALSLLGEGKAMVQILHIRSGVNLGSANKILHCKLEEDIEKLLSQFIMQYYRTTPPPHLIVSDIRLSKPDDIVAVLRSYHKKLDKDFKICCATKQPRKYDLGLSMVKDNLRQKQSLAKQVTEEYKQAFTELARYTDCPKVSRIDCIDVSHTRGRQTVCASVSCGQDGPDKSLYRLYNIEGERAGDDLAAIRQALMRKLAKKDEAPLPDILLIDGGIYQWQTAHECLKSFDLDNSIRLLAISKRENRKLGMEYLHLDPQRCVAIAELPQSVFRCLLQLRNEAHRFAITRHRAKRAKNSFSSQLDDIPLVGRRRRQALLNYFQDPKDLQVATVAELCKVPGVSQQVAQNIYLKFHPSS